MQNGKENRRHFCESQAAFQNAITAKRLSENEFTWNFAGNYMYMETIDGVYEFKNIANRQYLRVAVR